MLNPYYTIIYNELEGYGSFPLVKAIYDKIPDITADEVKDMQRAFAKEKNYVEIYHLLL